MTVILTRDVWVCGGSARCWGGLEKRGYEALVCEKIPVCESFFWLWWLEGVMGIVEEC